MPTAAPPHPACGCEGSHAHDRGGSMHVDTAGPDLYHHGILIFGVFSKKKVTLLWQ